jgi:hypothetical protein
MTKFKLTKEKKGSKYLYTVTDQDGKTISTRISTRDYVACTADGEYYFGRLDLVGKGDHGRNMSLYHARACEAKTSEDAQHYRAKHNALLQVAYL